MNSEGLLQLPLSGEQHHLTVPLGVKHVTPDRTSEHSAALYTEAPLPNYSRYLSFPSRVNPFIV